MSEVEFLSIGIDASQERTYTMEEIRSRNLIVAIIEQAIGDLFQKRDIINHKRARNFLSLTDPWFCYYCNLLGIDPEYIVKKIDLGLNQKIKVKPKEANQFEYDDF